MNRYVYIFLYITAIAFTVPAETRMSGAGAGILGGGIGFLAGTMVASSVARNNRSYNTEPQVVYTTVDKRPIEKTVVNNHYYNSDSEDSDFDGTDDDSDYEYKVVKVKKKTAKNQK